eukprot:1749779-Rhodomonas_salina.1
MPLNWEMLVSSVSQDTTETSQWGTVKHVNLESTNQGMASRSAPIVSIHMLQNGPNPLVTFVQMGQDQIVQELSTYQMGALKYKARLVASN